MPPIHTLELVSECMKIAKTATNSGKEQAMRTQKSSTNQREDVADKFHAGVTIAKL